MEGLKRIKLYTINITQRPYEKEYIVSCDPPHIYLPIVYDKKAGMTLVSLTIRPDVFDLNSLLLTNKFNKTWKP